MFSLGAVWEAGEEEEGVGETRPSAWYDISLEPVVGNLARHSANERPPQQRNVGLIARLMDNKVFASKGVNPDQLR